MQLRIFTRLRAKDIFDFYIYTTGRAVFIFFILLSLISFYAAFFKGCSFLRAFLLLCTPIIYAGAALICSVKKAAANGLRETVFNENGVFSRNSSCEYSWLFKDIPKITELKKYFYIYTINDGTFVLPKYQLGARENILILRDLFIKHIPPKRLNLLNDNAVFKDKRKASFDVQNELMLAKNEEKIVKTSVNPIYFIFCIIFFVVCLSFFYEFTYNSALKINFLKPNTANEIDYERENLKQGYIEASKKLLIISDDILCLKKADISNREYAVCKKLEINAAKEELRFFCIDDGDFELKELDRLNTILMNRLFEIADIIEKYYYDIDIYDEELQSLRDEALSIKGMCSNIVD